MKIKITEKLLCIPPYISTTWDKVAFLFSEIDPETATPALILNLDDGKVIRIPGLDPSIIDVAFTAHMKFLEGSGTPKKEAPLKMGLTPEQLAGMPIRFGIQGMPGGIEGMEAALQHNPSQSDIPLLPKEMLEKVAQVAKLLTNGDLANFPKPEPHCHCLHCQVAAAIHGTSEGQEASAEEPISEDDLRFRNWDIVQTGDKLYVVTNPLDPREHYNVFLGTPLGCTCGQTHCEHIKAVLAS